METFSNFCSSANMGKMPNTRALTYLSSNINYRRGVDVYIDIDCIHFSTLASR